MTDDSHDSTYDTSLAIVGMAGRFPGARSVAAFWQNLVNGLISIRFFSDEELLAKGIKPDLLNDPSYVKAGTVVEDVDLFDAAFFGLTPREAQIMDPQSRLFLQCAWEALEDAGYDSGAYEGLIGVFAGKRFPQYMANNLASNLDLMALMGGIQLSINNESDSLASMLSYRLDLKGPSVSVQTFCSTSMVAVHLACQSLLAYECDMALAGGVAIQFPHGVGYMYQEGGILSPDGHCRTFDAKGQGSVFGDGLGIVVLKRLEDALKAGDHVYAVIRGSAMNNDGIVRAGYTAPGLNGQAAVIAEALGSAGVDAETIGYVEAHGTATALGDSVELEATNKAFRKSTDKVGFCALGSVKPNVGHMDRASGVTGLIKTALVLHHKAIPPSLNFETPNPDFDWEGSPFYVNTKLTEWKSNGAWPRRASVSSFGLGGTNVHVVLEEAPDVEPSGDSRPYQLLLLSAKTENGLETTTANLVGCFRDNPTLSLPDAAYTLQVGRAAFDHRRVVVYRTREDAADALATGDPGRVFTAHRVRQQHSAAFVFPGVGDHYPGMALHLYQTEPVFKHWVDRCCALLKPHLSADLLEILYPANEETATGEGQDANLLRKMLGRQRDGALEGPLQQTAFAQPAVFVVEYALAQLLMAWGIRPKALIGYSLGEYTAACVAGVLSLEDALALVAKRAQMIQELEEGAMLTVSLPEVEAAPFLDNEVALSGVLTPNVCVLAGPLAAIGALEGRLTEAGVTYRRLPTSHAFHTPMLAPMVERFTAAVKGVRLNPPEIPYLSNVSGDWITEAEATDAHYWARHLCQTVRLSSGFAALLAKEDLVLLEVGPGQALNSLIKQHPACGRERLHLVLPTLPYAYESQEAGAFLLNTLGKLWLAGVPIDWAGFYRDERRHRVSLPTYPFEQVRHWVEPREMTYSGEALSAKPETEQIPAKKPDVADWFYRPVWEKTALPALPTGDVPSPWLIFCDGLGLAEQIAAFVAQRGGLAVRVTAGEQSTASESDTPGFTIRPGNKSDYQALCRELLAAEMVPQKIVHLWSVGRGDEMAASATRFAAAQDMGFYSLVHLMQALEEQGIGDQMEIAVVTSNAQPVTGGEALHPEKATVFGACLAITQECLNVKCRALDLDVPPAGPWPLPEIAETLLADLLTPSTDWQVAYRDGERFKRTYEALRLEEQPVPPLRQGGTYLITGGLGGIGLVLAEHLARTVQAKLVLIGRSALPARGEWEKWLATHAESDRLARRIRSIQALESLGGQVLVFQADVADRRRMQEVVEATAAQFGRIDGVIHAAGISDEAFDSILSISPRQCELHFQPKVYGLYALEAALDGQNMDFCLIFSSLSSVLGGLGFVGYTAANICMDVIAHKHNRTSAVKWTSVNWDTWRVRQPQGEGLGSTIAMYEMSPQEGIAAFERVLANRAGIDTRIVHSTGDLDARIRQWVMLESLQGGARARSTTATARPDLPTAYVAANTDYERRIAAVWQELLGIDQIGLYDNFFDLGGNSLIGLQVIARLKKEFGTQIPAVALFEAPTVGALARYLQPESKGAEAADVLAQALLERRKQARQKVGQQGIAVVGMAGKFPGASSVSAFWQNLCDGVESVTFFTDEELAAAGVPPGQLSDPNYVKARPILEQADLFDASFFGYSPRDAELTDPQHRLFLECAWEALETAGYDSKTYPGLIGVFGGTMASSYLIGLFADPALASSLGGYGSNYQLIAGNEVDSLATTVSYKLNLKGPSFSVQTFCSTSMVATHLACQSLLNGECDMALAGGVSVRVPVKQGYTFVEGGMESPDGHCRTFDARAKGTMFGDGVGVVVLKRLDDALADGDVIHAVIRGSAMNNDGSMKVGYSAPSVEAQAEVVAAALENAEVTADSIGYVEAHGTATELGDPIEMAALIRAFRQTTDMAGYCAIGSVKTNVGHLDRAAGVSGLIKTVLTVKHGLVPPSLHFESPNPEIDFKDSPFRVNTQLTVWESNGRPRRAGVNSLGMGGTNVHAVVEEAPTLPPSGPSRPWQLLLLSARNEPALEEMTANWVRYLRATPDLNLADAAYTLQVGRHAFEHRRMLVCRDVADALAALEPLDPRRALTHYQPDVNRSVAFLFPGVGDHYLQMGKELYESEPLFRETVEQCCSILFPYLGVKLRDLLYPADEPAAQTDSSGVDLRAMLRRDEQALSPAAQRLNRTEVAQPVVFVIEYALARLLLAWGVRPSALVGHSLGEYVAACLAGVLSLEDALKLVAERARMIQELPAGSMLAVALSREAVQPLLSEEISLALHNGQETCVLAGSPEAISRLEAELTAREIACRRLDTTHAFHSHMMAPLAESLTKLVKTIKLNPPRIPYLSNVTGTWITDEQATDPAYWARHLCQPVRFCDALNALLAEKGRVLLEVGPGQALGSFAKQHPACAPEHLALILPTMRYAYDYQSDLAFLLGTLGKLWMVGCAPNWAGFYADESRRRLLLPTYPFQRQRYWLGSSAQPTSAQAAQADATPLERKPLEDWFYLPIWSQTAPRLLSSPAPSPETQTGPPCWLLFVDDCGLGTQVADWLTAREQHIVTVQPGDSFTQVEENHRYTLRPHMREDYGDLLRILQQQELKPTQVVHLWSVTPDEPIPGSRDSLGLTLNRGFYSLMSLAQALGDMDMAACSLSVVTSHVQSVIGGETICPEKTTVLGPCKVIPQEYPDVLCRSIDVALPAPDTWQRAALLESLVAELASPIGDTVVALRDRRRWMQTFQPLRLPPLDGGKQSFLRQNGVYLVTGGLGGIGMALAEHLARSVQARLILLGRSALPPREEWEQVIATAGDESSIGRKIRGMQRLEELGAQVLALAADVADEEQMRAAVEQAVARFGTIHGVVHAAGVPGVGLIQVKTADAAAGVLAPKVLGTLVLERILQDVELDFLVLFSSETAFTGGGLGQIDYCAANAFLDGYAQHHAGRQQLITSINWGEWQWNAWEEGLAGFSPEVQAYFRENRRQYGIAFAEGAEALERILAYRLPWVAVSTRDLRPVVEGSSKQSAMRLLLEATQQAQEHKHPRPALGTSYAAPRNDLERQIAALWSDLLGIAEIGINDNFFDLGGNSLTGLQIASRLRRSFEVDLHLRVIFEAPTVCEMALAIEEILLGEIEELSEDEATHLAASISGLSNSDESL